MKNKTKLSSSATVFKMTRAKKKMNQTQFAKKLGCSQGLISKIESGKTMVSPEMMGTLKKSFKTI